MLPSMVPAQVTGMKCPREMRLLQLLNPGNGLGTFSSADRINSLCPVLQRLGKPPLLILGHLGTLRVSGWKG